MKVKHLSLIEANEDGINLKALLFLTLGSKYLNLVYNVLDESVKSGNPHIISSDSVEGLKDYFEKTRWSDFQIIEPVLFFNFYQGLELNMKGLLLLVGNTDVPTVHNLRTLFENLETLQKIPKEIKNVLREHIFITGENNPLIQGFLVQNGKNIDHLYESLRYPADKTFENLNSYFMLHYQESNSLEYFKKVMVDIKSLQKSGTVLYSELTNTGRGGS